MATDKRAALETAEDALFDETFEADFQLDEQPTKGEVWKFLNDTAGQGEHSNLYWDFPLPDGSQFSDAKWSILYRSIQAGVDAMFETRGHQRARRPGSLSTLSVSMRYFVGWMAIFGHTDLSCMDATRFDDYAHWIEMTKCRNTEDGQKSVTVLHARSLLAFPATLFRYNEVLQGQGLPPIPTIPYSGRSVMEVANDICKRANEGYQPVPDGLFVPAMNKVVQWLDCQIDEIQEAIDCYLRPYAPKFSGAIKAAKRRDELAKLKFSSDKDTGQPWFAGFNFSAPITATRHYTHGKSRRGRKVELNAGHAIRHLLNAARDCCTIALQGTVAMRISEICGLQVFDTKSINEWPSCVTVERSLSGMDELFFITGTVFKGKAPPRPGRWLAGTRPVGSSDIPIPIRALMKLVRLYAPWRRMSGRSDLILDFSNRVGLAKEKEKVSPVRAERLNEGQKEWIKEYVKAGPEFDNWDLSSHQWRMTFARFCVRVDRTLLPAISRHFHHISIKTTEQHYTGEDLEIRYLIREAALELAAELLYDATRSKGQASGRLMEEIPEVVEEMGHHVDMDNADESQAFLRATMESDNTWGWDMLWCGCLFRPEHAKCHLKAAVRKIIPIAPALDALGPFSSCSQCKNQIVLPRHRPFWEERRKKLIAERKGNKEKGLSDVDFIIGYRLAQCNEILRRIRRSTPS
ncbi:hypothetical protein B0G71_0719 [Paraburkholderia sp. BL27I4N3]|uniref:site-specific integrase n=1 Tax=Paraburkholderia sp. BL27I4N3 TaxID=1938805 RepID=UPI000E26CDA2|nr:site-specific integrase [Paraburkholderia sp. BL27I4N3]REE17753.1 hypothetical protein B0G71_0719 [Paraburkholderia sp. BL27I4N3]